MKKEILKNHGKNHKKITLPAIKKAPQQKYYPVSLQQQGVWLQTRIEPGSILWNTSHSWLYQGPLNIHTLKNAIKTLIRRHASMRCNFLQKDNNILQVIHEKFSLDWFFKFADISSLPEDQKETAARSIEKKAAIKTYNLASDPLIRFTLIRFDQNRHLLVISKHHIISDVSSRQIIWKELVSLYNNYAAHKPPQPEPIEIQYHDYALWQQDFLETPYYKKQKEYWLSQLSGKDPAPLPVLNLPTDFPRTGNENKNSGTSTYTITLDQQLTARLRTLSLQNRATFSSVFLSGFYILLHKYSGQNNFVIGTLFQGRNIYKNLFNKIIGLFANQVAIRLNINENATLKELLAEINKKTRQAYENQDFLYEDLIRTMHPQRSQLHAPIYQAVFNMLKITAMDKDPEGLTREKWQEFAPVKDISSQYALSLYVEDQIKKINLKILYTSDRYTRETIKRMMMQYTNILTKMIAAPRTNLNHLEIISPGEKETILYEFNNTDADYPVHKTILQLFQEQAEKKPDYIALQGGLDTQPQKQGYLTYRQLNHISEQLAYILQKKGIKPDHIVGIMVERSAALIIGIFAIIKAGGAYLPIDPSYPQQRIEYMLSDSKATVLITSSPRAKELNLSSSRLLNFSTSQLLAFPSSQLQLLNFSPSRPSNLAYIIYTSGSTGKPKGVMIEHRPLVNRLNWMQKKYPINHHDTILHKTPFTFDVSVWEIFWWSLYGARLCLLPPGGEKKPQLIIETIYKHHISVMHFVPSMLTIFLEYVRQTLNTRSKKLTSLKQIIASGEALSVAQVNAFKHLLYKNDRTKLANLYGPTEAAIDVSYFDCPLHLDHDLHRIPIGKPIDNTRLLVLNRAMIVQPIGAAGQLCITGHGLARGYLNRPELTFELFRLRRPGGLFSRKRVVPPPGPAIFRKSFLLIYQTGDMARWLTNGNIEYLGRIDNQVKIRGNRIETGEIEASLNQHYCIKESVVAPVTDEAGRTNLCAYIVLAVNSTNNAELDPLQLREFLNKKLPEYMIPSYFIKMESFPLTHNGKIDRKSLPIPDPEGSLNNQTDFEPPDPKNDIQLKLTSVWQEIMGLKKIGIKDNFFAIGGDSIKAIQIASRLSTYGYKTDINLIFKYPTIKKLAKYVNKITVDINQNPATGDIIPIPIQKWFLNQDFKDKHHWNLAFMVYRSTEIEIQILKIVLKRILEHHDLLRACLSENEQVLTYKEINNHDVPLETIDLTSIPENDLEMRILPEANRIQTSIDLFKGPLIKTGLFKTRNGDHLLIVIHHLAIDGISWRILFEDISSGYQQAKQGQDIRFPPKTHSYKRWSEEIQVYSRSKKLLKEYDYWKKICTTRMTGLSTTPSAAPTLITKEKTGKLKDYYRYQIQLDQDESQLIVNEVNRAYYTEINDILLSALGLAVRDCFGTKNIIINLEGHGREKISENIDISRTVGWFTTQFPLLLEVQENQGENREDQLSLHIQHTKETLRKIPKKGIGFGILRYISALPEKDQQVLDIQPEISFNYLGQFDEDLTRTGFKKSPYGTGSTRSPESEQPFKININGMLVNQKLSFTFNCDRNTYDNRQVENLAQRYKYHLQQIIRHCREIEEPVHTPGDYDAKNLDFHELTAITQQVGKNNIDKIYDLSPMQEGMLFHYLLDPNRQAYLVQLVYKLQGEINPALFKESYQQIIDKYDVFRTAFIYKNIKQPRQVVLKKRNAEFRFHDQTTSNQPFNRIGSIIKEDRERGFDLQTDLLLRFTLLKTHENENKYTLLLTYHHIILDGWSTNLLLKDFITIYCHLKTGQPQENDIANLHPYLDYIKWLENQDLASAGQYWRDYLSGFDQVTRIPAFSDNRGTDKEYKEYKEQYHTIEIDNRINRKLKELTRQWNVTLNNILLAVWSFILQRYTGAPDIVFGNVISGRNIPINGIEQVIGLFINTIPLRVKINDQESLAQMAGKIRENLIESQNYGFLPLGEIQGYAAVDGQVLEHLYTYENYPINKELRSPQLAETVGFKITDRYSIEHTDYHLNLMVIPRTQLRPRLQFNENVYDLTFVSALAGHIRRVLEQLVLNPQQPTGNIEIITAEEKQQLLQEFNNTDAPYPEHKTILQLFIEQVEKNPHYTALIGNEEGGKGTGDEGKKKIRQQYISYKELHERSGRLAYQLQKKGVKPDNIVGIMVERSAALIIGIFAIVKAGGAYLPIDPGYPEERIEYMLADSSAPVLVTTAPPAKDFNLSSSQLLIFSTSQLLVSPSSQLLNFSTTRPTDLAYLIYTSGSTGKPKGVMIEHRTLVNRLNWMQKKYPIGPNDTILHKTPFTFDVSVWEIFWWSLTGAKICLLIPGGEKDPRQIAAAIEKHRVTVMHFVPSMLAIFLEYIKQIKQSTQLPIHIKPLTTLKQVIASGEALGMHLVNLFNQLLAGNGTALANLYGPTEATIDVSYFDCPNQENIEHIPIGKPIDNIRLLIFNRSMQLQPLGAAGELCIGGHGLARGYLNRPALTAGRFILATKAQRHKDVYFSWSPATLMTKFYRLYKTGDLARWLPDGNIEYLGRMDNQVKIRGNRIELGEIENRLNRYQNIKESVVTVIPDKSGSNTLCAYLLSHEQLSVTQLREYLGTHLPDYMIPSYFVRVDEIPLTPNGKVDRKSLPAPDKSLTTGRKYVPPTNRIEEQLVNIWQELLNKEKIGIKDHFFELGGHSLLAMNMAFRLHNVFNLEIPLWDIFNHPTISQLALLIQKQEEKIEKIEKILTEIESMSETQIQEQFNMQ